MRYLGSICLISLLAVFPFVAEGAKEKDVKEELKGIAKEIQEKKILLKNTAKTEEKVSSELGRIEKSLKEKERKLRDLDLDLNSVEGNISRTMKEMEALSLDSERRKLDIQRRLVALYKSGDTGMARIVFSSESFPDMLENLRYMRAVMEQDRRMINGYQARAQQLDGLKNLLEREANRKEKIRKSIEQQKQEVQAEQRKKAAYLVQVRQDKKSYMISLRELEANAKRLQAMVERLEAMQRKSYSGKTEKKAGGNKANEVASFKGRGFRAQKGRLSYPVNGDLIGRFGKHKLQEFHAYTLSNGISLSAPTGADIHAVYEGKVIFADYFKGYGNMIIVDHGQGFYSLYAHASKLLKEAGASVSKNEILGNVGDVDSTRGSMLYFELRHQGKPVDPLPWFK